MPKKQIVAFIDFFYPPFRRFMPEQTFRYAACGGFNFVLDIGLFYIFIHYIFPVAAGVKDPVVYVAGFAFKQHVAAFFFSFPISFPVGFLLMRNIVFTDSNLRGRIQLFRYFVMVMICILLNYVFIRLFVEFFHLYPTVGKILTSVLVIIFSYLTQRNFTFKKVPADG